MVFTTRVVRVSHNLRPKPRRTVTPTYASRASRTTPLSVPASFPSTRNMDTRRPPLSIYSTPPLSSDTHPYMGYRGPPPPSSDYHHPLPQALQPSAPEPPGYAKNPSNDPYSAVLDAQRVSVFLIFCFVCGTYAWFFVYRQC
jgi:hypothetical protein